MTWKDIPRNPSATMLRQFGFLCVLFFGGLGAWKLSHESYVWGTIWLCLGLAGGLLGAVYPKALKHVFVGWMMAVFPVGWVVSHVLLSVIFFLLFTPVAFVFRLVGRDSLKLRRPQVDSYWLPKPAAAAVGSYYHQY